MKNTDGEKTNVKVKNVVSKKSIFLAKKTYIDILQGELPDGTFVYDEHVRNKGISNSCIRHTAKLRNEST